MLSTITHFFLTTRKALFQKSHTFQKKRSSLKIRKVQHLPLLKSIIIGNEQLFFHHLFADTVIFQRSLKNDSLSKPLCSFLFLSDVEIDTPKNSTQGQRVISLCLEREVMLITCQRFRLVGDCSSSVFFL